MGVGVVILVGVDNVVAVGTGDVAGVAICMDVVSGVVAGAGPGFGVSVEVKVKEDVLQPTITASKSRNGTKNLVRIIPFSSVCERVVS